MTCQPVPFFRSSRAILWPALLVTLSLALGRAAFGEEKAPEAAPPQGLRILFLGDNPWNGGTLRRVFEAFAATYRRNIEITEIPAKDRPLGEVIAGLIESTPEKGRFDVVVAFDHPLRQVVQRDRAELITEIDTLEGLAPRIVWILSPYRKPTLRVETERQKILGRLPLPQGFSTLPLIRLFHQTRKLAGGAAWVNDLSLDRPTSFSDYLTAALLAQVLWGPAPQFPNDIRISDTASLRIPEEALPVLAKVLATLEITLPKGPALANAFAPELSPPQRFVGNGLPLTLTSGVIPGFFDWNADGRLELVLCGRETGQWEIWTWPTPDKPLSLAQAARFPAETVNPDLAAMIKAGATVFQLVDFDYDRHPDLLIGTNEGKLALCRGQAGMVFGRPEVCMLEDGKPFQVPYLHRAFLGELTKDGVWDLVLGDGAGQVFLTSLVEQGGRFLWGQPRPVTIEGLTLQVDGEASPVIADWDLDGLPDLIVGCRNGGVLWIRNVGSNEQPAWAPPVSLVWPPEEEETLLIPYRNGMELWTPTPGWSTQPSVADLDGDHLPDLIIGDSNCRVVKYRDFTAEEQKEVDALLKKRREIVEKLSQSPPEEIARQKAALWEITLELIQKSTDRRYERCGWVWYLRRQSLATPDE